MCKLDDSLFSPGEIGIRAGCSPVRSFPLASVTPQNAEQDRYNPTGCPLTHDDQGALLPIRFAAGSRPQETYCLMGEKSLDCRPDPEGDHMEQPASSTNKLWFLRHIRLFDGMSSSEMQEMEKITRMEEVKKRQPLYLPGDPSSNVYLLKKGRVKIANTAPSGKEVTFEILEPGEVFGELEVLEDAPRSTSAETLDDTLICVIPRKDFDQYLAMHPNVTVKLTKLIGLRLKKIQSRVEDLVFRDVPARLAHLLVELSKSDGVKEATGIRLKAKLTHQEMANLIGCSRETVSTIMGQFRDQGLIHMDGRTITLLKPDALSHLAS